MQLSIQLALGFVTATALTTVAPAQQAAFGLPHAPLGQAQLSAQGGSLVVSNIGSSGLDGVRIELGEAQFQLIQFDVPPAAALPVGARMAITTEGVLGGQPGLDIWTINVTNFGNQFGVALDTTAVQTGTLRVEAWLGGRVVDTVNYAPAPNPAQILAVFQPEGCFVDPFWPMGSECWAMLGLASPGPVTLTGSTQVIADQLVLASSNQGSSVDSLSGNRMQTDMPLITLHDEALGMFHLPHRAVGQAQFEATGGKLKVSNLGSSGCDGVSIDLGDTTTHEITFDPVLPASQLTDGTRMEFTTFGQLSGVPDQEIWTLRLEDIGQVFGAALDTTIVQPQGVRVDVLSNGAVVDSQLMVPPPLPGDIIVMYPPLGCRTNPFLPVPQLAECHAIIEMAGQVQIQIPGHQAVQGDEIRIASFQQAESVDSLSETRILAGGPPGGIDQFLILDEQIGNVGPAVNVYCTAKASSAGCLNLVSTSDLSAQPTSGADDYDVLCSSVQGFKNGLLIGGITGPAAMPFLGGTLCVNPPLKRGPLMNSGGSSPASCDGSYATRINNGSVIPFGLDAGPGNSAWYQYWYRDPADASFGSALSNAVQLDFE